MNNQHYPVVPLRDVVLFPGVIMPLYVARAKSRAALERSGSAVFFVAQREAALEDPAESNLFELGTLGEVLQAQPLPDGSLKILVKGLRRARRLSLRDNGALVEAELAFPDKEAAPEIDHNAADIRSRIEAAGQIDRARLPQWPVSKLQTLLEDGSLSGLERLTRLRELFDRR